MSFQEKFEHLDRRLTKSADWLQQCMEEDERVRNDAIEAERRAEARRDRELTIKHQIKYDNVFRDLGQIAPEPRADEAPQHYRRRLLASVLDQLGDASQYSNVNPHTVPIRLRQTPITYRDA